jgi:hypothetical protein
VIMNGVAKTGVGGVTNVKPLIFIVDGRIE